MCGFVGFIDPKGLLESAEREPVLRGMTATLIHRGPDADGVWLDDDSGVALGHRRLSIVDLSVHGHQPMLSSCGRYVIVYNGEIYNFLDLHEELRERGHLFRGGSDTEVLLASVREWGVQGALQRFVGMFAFALWDRQEHVLSLCRDRVGEKPLYYGWSGGVFLFGSELKALRAHPSWRGDLDRDALALFVRRCYVPAPFSIYQGIRKLEPGCFIQLEPGCSADDLPDPIPFWSAHDAAAGGRIDPFRGSPDEAVDELDRLLRDAVSRQMVADVPLGAFLSGGVDSSTIVALMQAQNSRPVKTFSIGFHEERFNEAHFAKEVARHLGTDHVEMYVTPAEAMAVIPRLPTLYDEPFADSSQIPTFLVSRLARREVTVSLSGDGGDELFGGYVRHEAGPRVWNYIRRIPLPIRQRAGRALMRIPPHIWDVMGEGRVGSRMLPARLRQRHIGEKAWKLGSVLAAGNPEAIYAALTSAWDADSSVVIGGREPATLLDHPGALPPLDDFASRMMYLDLMTYLPDDILVKVDRASMGVSLESRTPFLDHRVVELAWRLPPELKIREGVGKWPLRQVLYRYVPAEMIERPKTGFAVPVGEWIRGPLREWAESLLDENKLRAEGIFHPEPIRRYWAEHKEGTADRKYQLWCILMFQAWLDESHSRPLSDAASPNLQLAAS